VRCLINQGLDAVESKLPKFIGPTAHGVIDYGHSAFFFTVGLLVAARTSVQRSRRSRQAASYWSNPSSPTTDLEQSR